MSFVSLYFFYFVQCAALSPAIRVREFSVTDIQNYPINLKWDACSGEDEGEMEIFPTNHPVPSTKLLTFYRKEPFSVSAYYNAPIPYPDSYIGQLLRYLIFILQKFFF